MCENKVKVSVLVITYNHAKYIAQALDSILMQKTNFNFEIIIGEDCSTDNTREIVKRYAENYPDKVKLLLAESNLGVSKNFERTLHACRGCYIAILEGDDYWKKPSKLQKQVDFLDVHLECSICCHNVEIIYENRVRKSRNYCHPNQPEFSELKELLRNNFVATPSVMFRNGLLDSLPPWIHSLIMVDWVLHILNAQFGKVGYIDEIMAAYRIHAAGVWNSATKVQRAKSSIKALELINSHLEFKYEAIILNELLSSYFILSILYMEKLDCISSITSLVKTLKIFIKILASKSTRRKYFS
jgi:glycosyltransferase involved in cell wall biosynthesis